MNSYRILHLEDDEFDVEMLQERLGSEGIKCEFDVVTHKKEFIEKLNSVNYSLIICDYSLPDFDGVTALLLAKKTKPKTPFIILSGTIGEERAVDCIKLGADDYILKSNTARLVSTIKRALKESELMASNIEVRRDLMRSEARFKAIFETALNALITMDHHGTILEVNKSFENIFGFKRTDVVNKLIAELIIPEVHRKKFSQGLQQYIESQNSKKLDLQVEMSVLNSKGIEFPIEIAIGIINPGDEPPIYSAFIQDISRRKKVENEIKTLNEELETQVDQRTSELQQANTKLTTTLEDLQQSQAQLIQSEKMASLGQLTAGVAHELNNPINAINASVIGLEQELIDIFKLLDVYEKLVKNPTDKELLERIINLKTELDLSQIKELIFDVIKGIKSCAKRTVHIVSGLRKFSRISSDKKEMTDIHQSIDETLDLLKTKLKNKVIVKKQFDTGIKEIKCHQSEINQVLMNVIVNAEQAIHTRGNILIVTKDYDDHITISVTDDGIGMDKDTINKIFDPFFSTKPVGEGTGLGLSISYGIIEKHGGGIEVNSEVGKGSEFVIELPYG